MVVGYLRYWQASVCVYSLLCTLWIVGWLPLCRKANASPFIFRATALYFQSTRVTYCNIFRPILDLELLFTLFLFCRVLGGIDSCAMECDVVVHYMSFVWDFVLGPIRCGVWANRALNADRRWRRPSAALHKIAINRPHLSVCLIYIFTQLKHHHWSRPPLLD